MIPIVVVTYNRPDSLRRILGSLLQADIPEHIRLYISVDGPGDPETVSVAEQFLWPHGKKTVIVREQRLGLKEHILKCGDLALENEGVILLEDDLYVSRYFYHYTLQAFSKYKNDARIAGISLYAQSFNETAQLPFIPLSDSNDVYFVQYASSWGQCWSKEQWTSFKSWYRENQNKDLIFSGKVPENVCLWPATSWKKYFIRYLAETDRFFVFPRESHTTNFGDPGQHYMHKELFLQLPLPVKNRVYSFCSLDDSMAVYDSYFEILPDILKKLNPQLKEHDFTTDLYGLKDVSKMGSPLCLTTRDHKQPLLHWGRELKPHEANVIDNIAGDTIGLVKTENCSNYTFLKRLQKLHSGTTKNYFSNLRTHEPGLVMRLIPAPIRNNPTIYKWMAKVYFSYHRLRRRTTQ